MLLRVTFMKFISFHLTTELWMDLYVSRISVCLCEPLLRAALDFGLVLSDISLSQSLGTNRDNSVGIVSMLRDRRIVCHFRQGQKILPFVETCSAVPKTACVTSTEGCFSGGKAAETWSGDLSPINVKVKNEWSYTSAPPYVFVACTWRIYITIAILRWRWSCFCVTSCGSQVYCWSFRGTCYLHLLRRN